MAHTLVIAEVGSNHMADFSTAVRLLEEAKRAGADACKFQLFTPHGLAHPTHPSQDTLQRFALPREWMPTLVEIGKRIGIDVSATPCDLAAVDLLHSLEVPWIKIASGDLTYHHLIRHAAATGRPLIVSTGMARWDEIVAAVRVAEQGWEKQQPNSMTRYCQKAVIQLLHCVAEYPAEIADANLAVIGSTTWELGNRSICGLSDHTTDILLPALAVAAGATVIEKHFRLAATPQESPDFPHSLSPDAFAEMVRYIRKAEVAVGNRNQTKQPLLKEEKMRLLARRGLYWAQDLPAGHVVRVGDVVAVRPGFSADRNEFTPPALQPSDVERLLGRALLRDVRQWGACEPREVGV